MPRANRIYVPGHIWHLTERCHQRDFLLNAREDRRRWLYWLYEARRRYDLCVLNYIVTRNHIHLLVRDRGQKEIATSMQLIAGCTGQAYNQRTGRIGAFWQDRYHATAVASDGHLLRCLAYIDLNMVRAGAVSHPSRWPESGYREIQRRPRRYRIIDLPALATLLGCDTPAAVSRRLGAYTERVLAERPARREVAWTESLAVGPDAFLQDVQQGLGTRGRGREVRAADGMSFLREPRASYVIGRAGYAVRAARARRELRALDLRRGQRLRARRSIIVASVLTIPI